MNLDILLVARPDHSLQIYNSLLKQSELSFRFVTFKVFPECVKKLFRMKKMVAISKNVTISYRLTFVNVLKYNYHIGMQLREDRYLSKKAGSILKKCEFKMIHYWPEYGNDEILEYKKFHPEVLTFADIHMPHPAKVYDEMIPVYENYGINPESTSLYTLKKAHNDLLRGEKNLLVPSSYVADTYKALFPGLNCKIVPYGVTKYQHYKKKEVKEVRNFVYAGRISLEKGSDLLLSFFKNHPKLTIHLFGSIDTQQKDIFDCYSKCDNIIFHGQVAKAELQSMMTQYDVGIHLSRFDAFSLAVGEMTGAGLPVIVSTSTGNKDEVMNHSVGYVCKLTPEDVEEAILKITNLDNYSQLIDNIDYYLIEGYKSYGDRMIEFYKDFCAKNEK